MTNEWTRSDCPICGRSYPHEEGYNPTTCGRFGCLQEAVRRELKDGNGMVSDLTYKAAARDDCAAEFLAELKESSQIADSMRDYWKGLCSGAA